MVFSSILFLFAYLTVALTVHYLSPPRWRNAILLAFSLLFYGWGEPLYIFLMVFTVVLDYFAGLLVARYKTQGRDRSARVTITVALAVNLAFLFFFKYWDLVATTLAGLGLGFMPVLGLRLPIGISFYTFQAMTYPVDVYRGDAKPQRSLVNFGTFVTLFPQLIAGPILKYKELADQVDRRSWSVEQFASGVEVFVVGLAKKVLLANNIGALWDTVKALPADQVTTAGAWLGILAFTLQIYFDFSGYSDMAVGLGRMLGFEFPRNFDYPYVSKSITEFWRRWHISLGSWFREYLYIPLGGNRVGRGRLFFQPVGGLGCHGYLARSQLELPHLGPLLCTAPHSGKGLYRPMAQKPAQSGAAFLRPLPHRHQLGDICPRGLFSNGGLSQGHVRLCPGRAEQPRHGVLAALLPAHAGHCPVRLHPPGYQGLEPAEGGAKKGPPPHFLVGGTGGVHRLSGGLHL